VGPLTMDPAVPVTPALEARVIQVQGVLGFLVRAYADSGPPSLCGSLGLLPGASLVGSQMV
jgi:hypothetical protein